MKPQFKKRTELKVMKFPFLDNNRDDNDVLTMAFVNMQPLNSIYDAERGFKEGTIFPNINKPFEAGGKRHDR